MLVVAFLVCAAALIGLALWRTVKGRRNVSLITGKANRMQHMRTLAAQHKVAASLVIMIDKDGAGDVGDAFPSYSLTVSLVKVRL